MDYILICQVLVKNDLHLDSIYKSNISKYSDKYLY